MKVTKQHIQTIDTFLKKDVKYWDLHIELIDHLASKLEQSEENVVIDNTFLKEEFGPYWQIKKTIKPKMVLINKKYRKLFFEEFKNQFKKIKTWIFILLVVTIPLLIFHFINYKMNTKHLTIIALASFLILLIYLILKTKLIHKSYALDISRNYFMMPIFFMNLPLILKEYQIVSIEVFKIIHLSIIAFSVIWLFTLTKTYIKINQKIAKQYKQYNLIK